MEQDYALIIGISDYEELGELSGNNDAIEIFDWLLLADGGDVPPENIELITSEANPYRPLQDDIDHKLSNIYEKARVDGGRRFYFFFAGHGLGASWNENGLCLPKWTRLFRNYALSSSAYLKLVVESGVFSEVFFFLDCCRNRAISFNPLSPLIGFVRPGEGAADCSSFVAYATSFDNAAFEAALPDNGSLKKIGYFTGALLQGLKGAAIDRSSQQITTNSLKDYLHRKVNELSNGRQKARFENNFTNEGVIKEFANAPKIALRLVFSAPGTIELIGPKLELILKKDFSEWPEEIPLEKGLYIITNMDTAKSKPIMLDITFDEDDNIQPVTIEI